jgi:hypothetical protein
MKITSTLGYSTQLSFKIDGAIKVFHDKQKLKQYITTKPPLQKIHQGILQTESKQNHERTLTPNHRRRKDKESESNSNSAAHNQTLKQQKQLSQESPHTYQY